MYIISEDTAGKLTLANSTIKNNIARSISGGGGVAGGGIHMQFGTKAVIINSVFENNLATVTEGNSSVSGGGLYIGDNWYPKRSPMTWIVNSRFTKNQTTHQKQILKKNAERILFLEN